MSPLRRTASEPRPQHIRLGDREIEARGLAGGFWSDLYYRSMTVSWPAFFASAAAIFAVLNGGFALVYFLGDRPIANAVPGRFLDLLYFSIETLATVGYGDMHPQTDYGHLVATVEIFTGMSFLAVMTGLVFARFSRPRARFVFAKYPIVAQHEGQPTLMIRVANARHNTISGATARLWLIRGEQSAEGQYFRRYHELKLLRNENPVFALSWTIFHVIDESSPLHGAGPHDLAQTDALLVLTISGLDDNSAQQLNARRNYAQSHIRWQHRYVDISSNADDGRLVLDYGKFHDVTPEQNG
jgi:inward rectifier potassium channel